MDNRTIAERLMNYAQYLEAQEVNLFRVRAYRRAAETVLLLDRPAADIVTARGRDGLEDLPGIGPHLAYTIEGLVVEGQFRTLGSDSGRIDSERLFGSLPGVGPRLARRIREGLHIETLEQLEQAALDGQLGQFHVGPKRLRGIMDALAGRLGARRLSPGPRPEPAVADLLGVDEEYRSLAARGKLPLLTPRRLNPQQEAWLPLLRVGRGHWQYRALFSNTATAHRLGQIRDWVVIYFQQGGVTGQRTVVTEARGELRGRRVVRGREQECVGYYRSPEEKTQPLQAS
jgi:hypothetical protein